MRYKYVCARFLLCDTCIIDHKEVVDSSYLKSYKFVKQELVEFVKLNLIYLLVQEDQLLDFRRLELLLVIQL